MVEFWTALDAENLNIESLMKRFSASSAVQNLTMDISRYSAAQNPSWTFHAIAQLKNPITDWVQAWYRSKPYFKNPCFSVYQYWILNIESLMKWFSASSAAQNPTMDISRYSAAQKPNNRLASGVILLKTLFQPTGFRCDTAQNLISKTLLSTSINIEGFGLH